jgi:hypothetical protein
MILDSLLRQTERSWYGTVTLWGAQPGRDAAVEAWQLARVAVNEDDEFAPEGEGYDESDAGQMLPLAVPSSV